MPRRARLAGQRSPSRLREPPGDPAAVDAGSCCCGRSLAMSHHHFIARVGLTIGLVAGCASSPRSENKTERAELGPDAGAPAGIESSGFALELAALYERYQALPESLEQFELAI